MAKRKVQKKLVDFIPQKDDPEMVLVQTKIEKPLRDKVKKQLDKDGITWKELMEAAMLKYLDEQKRAS